MDMVLLGFLFLRPFTMYELKQALEQSVSFFYSASFGSIHPALKRLAADGFVEVRALKEDGRRKKRYSITGPGRQEHRRWLRSEIPEARSQDEGLLRLFFLAALPKSQRAALVEKHVCALEERAAALAAIVHQTNTGAQAEAPAAALSAPRDRGLREGLPFRMLTAEFGMRYYEFERQFYQDVLDRIKKGEL